MQQTEGPLTEGFSCLGFRGLGFRGLGVRGLGFRGLGFGFLGFRVQALAISFYYFGTVVGMWLLSNLALQLFALKL